jgi:PTH1 family peptidyl-tRNA hydrolase
MEAIETSDGVTFVRDDIKASLSSTAHVLDFLARARATRKVAVFGTISDYSARPGTVYAKLARQALDVADLVVCVGARAGKCLSARDHARGDALHAFFDKEVAARFLARTLRAGDLVLLKGSIYADRLGILTQVRLNSADYVSVSAEQKQSRSGPLVVVGLGNIDERLTGTPHNVGLDAVRALASAHRAPWQEYENGWIAQVELGGRAVKLVTLNSEMNRSGPVLRSLCDRLGATTADLIVVLDDVGLPPGKARTRMRGGDGGHRGLRSIIEAFDSDDVVRIRIGVGAPADRTTLATYVLAPFSPEIGKQVASCCASLGDLVLVAAKSANQDRARRRSSEKVHDK